MLHGPYPDCRLYLLQLSVLQVLSEGYTGVIDRVNGVKVPVVHPWWSTALYHGFRLRFNPCMDRELRLPFFFLCRTWPDDDNGDSTRLQPEHNVCIAKQCHSTVGGCGANPVEQAVGEDSVCVPKQCELTAGACGATPVEQAEGVDSVCVPKQF